MIRRDFLKMALLAAGCPLAAMPTPAAQAGGKPSILFLTVDDMNCDSLGAFGCKVKGISPNLDRLASEGVRFTHAHVQVGNCVPSRNVMQTGRYPHTSGVEGFYKLTPDFPILPDLMKANGYFTGIKNKVAHSTPYHPYEWDIVEDRSQQRGASRSPKSFYEFTRRAITASQEAGKPFYLVVNATDPHKPFFGEEKSKQMGFDDFPPSRLFAVDDVPVPGFLPDLPEVRHEIKQYYDCVRRADDCAGETLRALKELGLENDTVIMFLSDHGMPFPFAKTNVYHHSSRTPWIVRWPGTVKAGTVDDRHMISAIDFMPTILNIAGIEQPSGLQGRSFLPLLRRKTQDGRDYVIKEYNENSGGGRHPMRSVDTRKYGYIFNPWSNGTRKFRTATQGTRTYKLMVEKAETDPAIAARLKHFDYRTLEEFYDYEKDPDALRNLIDEPAMRNEIDRLRKILEDWMVETEDPCLVAFRNRGNPDALEKFMREQQAASDERRKKARSKQKGAKPGARLIAIAKPGPASRGGTARLTVRHTLPGKLGEQLLHVTAKRGDGKRIDRKVLAVSGTGKVEVTFAIPDDAGLKAVSYAAFVGKDFPGCLQHVTTKAVTVE